MTMTATTVLPRRAAAYSVCAADGCRVIITPGSLITRIPGRGFAHSDCARQAASTEGERCD
jgi:hypothetical protein